MEGCGQRGHRVPGLWWGGAEVGGGLRGACSFSHSEGSGQLQMASFLLGGQAVSWCVVQGSPIWGASGLRLCEWKHENPTQGWGLGLGAWQGSPATTEAGSSWGWGD